MAVMTNEAMGSHCERVYRDEADVARLRQLIERLPADAHVRLKFDDGSLLTGIVGERPVLQLFFGPDGREGANAVLRLERDAPGKPDARDFLIDRIVDVDLLPEASQRRPVAANAAP